MIVSDALTAAWSVASAEAGSDHGYYKRRLQIQLVQPAYAGILIPLKARRLSFDLEKGTLSGLNMSDKTRGYKVETESQSNNARVFVHIEEVPAGISKDLFEIFCADLLVHVSKCLTAPEAARTLYRRLQNWKIFFQNRSSEGLSRDEYIGLFGELEFFESCLQRGGSPMAFINAWQGPLGANQDFLFGNVAVEVKAVTANDPNAVQISNIRQMDDIGLHALCLRHIAYDFREGAGRQLTTLVQSLKDL